MHQYRAITWDHPRGYNALAAAAAALDPVRDRLSISWERHSLEHFESHPIADLCARYDLVVLDHPHVGEAVASQCLRPLEDLFRSDLIAEVGAAAIGPTFSSYRYAGRQWALPLDVATQVMAARPDLLNRAPPRIWDEVAHLSATMGGVAMSLAGPHALLSFFSIAAAFGEPPATGDPEVLVSMRTGSLAYDLLADLASRSPPSVRQANPIGILGHMSSQDDVVLCPLVYGYVNYAAPERGRALHFSDAPRATSAGPPGSTLGGTGIGISARCDWSPELERHLLWLVGEEAQDRFLPFHDGQPSRRSAWADARVNERWGHFYRDTVNTVEAAYVRPRYAGYIAFQTRASGLLRQSLDERRSAPAVIAELQTLYRESRPPGGER
jgi:multiple sugar transport system substrate-binding protein